MKRYKKGVAFGVFDLFHIGHLNLLKRAKEQCEFLVVGVSSDEYCQQIKGKTPVVPFLDRLQIVQAIEYVDWATIQADWRPKKKTVETFRPDVIFVGTDHKGKQWDGAKLGIPVVYLPYTEDISTTILREKLKNG